MFLLVNWRVFLKQISLHLKLQRAGLTISLDQHKYDFNTFMKLGERGHFIKPQLKIPVDIMYKSATPLKLTGASQPGQKIKKELF